MSLRRGIIAGWCPSLGPTAGTLIDRFARNNHGTLSGFTLSSDWSVDGGSYALLFGANKSVSMRADGVTMSGDFLVSFWARSTVTLTANRNIMQKQVGGLSLILLNDTVFSARSQSTGLVTWSIPSIGTSWTHFAILRSQSSARVFVNGLESVDGAKAFGGNFVIDCLGSVISPSTNFPGYIDDVAATESNISSNTPIEFYRVGRGGIYKTSKKRRFASKKRGLRRKFLLTGQV